MLDIDDAGYTVDLSELTRNIESYCACKFVAEALLLQRTSTESSIDVNAGISGENYLHIDIRSQVEQIIQSSATMSKAQLFAPEALSIYRSEVASSFFKTDGKISQLSIPRPGYSEYN